MADSPLRRLPSVNDLLERDEVQPAIEEFGRDLVVRMIREEIGSLRQKIASGQGNGELPENALIHNVRRRCEAQFQPVFRRVINGTGILLHTNLGRAPLAESAARAAYQAARGYLNLELDLATGKRSSRQAPIKPLLMELTGAESATVVNNNAAATLIVLRVVASGKEVILSRGQLVEIGGSFRIPEIMSVSGAILREVGTTNITRPSDYENAVGPNTAALLQVHPSNYRITGFTETVSIESMVAIGKKHQIPVIDDIGSGALIDFSRYGLEDEPVARKSIAAGADLVMFSGDKLLGGPQAGIIVGSRKWIDRIEKDPLMRAFRLDKMTLAALETTLRLHTTQDRARKFIPLYRQLEMPLEQVQRLAEDLAGRLRSIPGLGQVKAREDVSFVGGGSVPSQEIASWVVEIRHDRLSEEELAHLLRHQPVPILPRVQKGQVLLDVRTLMEEDMEVVVAQMAALTSS